MEDTSSKGVEVLNLYRLDGDSNLKAFADVSFAGVFVVKGLRVVEGKNGLFVGMPRRQSKDGKWYNIAYPSTQEFKDLLSEVILEVYGSR